MSVAHNVSEDAGVAPATHLSAVQAQLAELAKRKSKGRTDDVDFLNQNQPGKKGVRRKNHKKPAAHGEFPDSSDQPSTSNLADSKGPPRASHQTASRVNNFALLHDDVAMDNASPGVDTSSRKFSAAANALNLKNGGGKQGAKGTPPAKGKKKDKVKLKEKAEAFTEALEMKKKKALLRKAKRERAKKAWD